MKIIKRFILGNLKTNCYLIEVNKKIILIDAGDNIDIVLSFLEEYNLNLDYVLLTHTHYDHIAGLNRLKEKLPNVIVVVDKKEQKYLRDSKYNLSYLDNTEYIYTGNYITYDEFDYKSFDFDIFTINGHSLNSVCLYNKKENILFSGDTLFKDSIGRSDFLNGNEFNLKKGIKEQILTLPNKTKVYPGHGFSTTVEHEQNNIFLKE